MSQERLNGTLQENLLTLLAHSDEHGKIVASLVDTSLFEGDYRVLAERCVDYWRTQKQAPKSHVDDLIAEILDDEHNKRAPTFRRILVAMIELSESINAPYIISKLRAFIRLQKLKEAILKSAETLNAQQEVAIESVEAIWHNLLREREVVIDQGIRLTAIDRVITALTITRDEFRTGIMGLDDRHVVPARGTVTLLLGGTGKGKSWFLVSVGKHAAFTDHKKVLHITLEMSEELVVQRYYQNLFSVPKRAASEIAITRFVHDKMERISGFKTIKIRPDFSLDSPLVLDEIGIRAEHLGTRFGNIYIKQFPTRSLTMTQLRGYLDLLELTEGFVPDMIILDYIGIVKTAASDTRISLIHQWQEFRGICVERNAAGVSVQQLSKEGFNSQMSMPTHVAEAWQLIGDTDTVITLSQTRAEEMLRLARLYVAKARSEQDKFALLITQAYSIGQFAIESMILDQRYFKILDEQTKDTETDGEADE